MRSALLLGALSVVAVFGCSSKKQPPTASHSPLADSADQVMYGARFVLNDQGVARAHMVADTAYFFDANTRVEVEKPVVTFFNAGGAKDAVLTARHGTYNSRTNAMQKNEISSDSAFVETEPGRRLEGIGFRSDPNMRNIVILKGASGFAKGVSTEPAAPAAASSTPRR